MTMRILKIAAVIIVVGVVVTSCYYGYEFVRIMNRMS